MDEKKNPLLWASTYHAGECLDPVAVAEAKARRKARKMAGLTYAISKDGMSDCIQTQKFDRLQPEAVANSTEHNISPKQMAIEGFKAQSEMVIESLERLITSWEERKESVIIEGVHLSLNFVVSKKMLNFPAYKFFTLFPYVSFRAFWQPVMNSGDGNDSLG